MFLRSKQISLREKMVLRCKFTTYITKKSFSILFKCWWLSSVFLNRWVDTQFCVSVTYFWFKTIILYSDQYHSSLWVIKLGFLLCSVDCQLSGVDNHRFLALKVSLVIRGVYVLPFWTANLKFDDKKVHFLLENYHFDHLWQCE